MRHFVTAICVLALVLVFAVAASAAPPEEGSFTITITASPPPDFEVLTPELDRAKFDTTATGFVTGDYFGGAKFAFVEWGIVDFGSKRGVNHGILTITTPTGDGEVTIRFDGQADFVSVWGNFRILSGEGIYDNLHGQGTYATTAGDPFSVDFSGRFHRAPK